MPKTPPSAPKKKPVAARAKVVRNTLSEASAEAATTSVPPTTKPVKRSRVRVAFTAPQDIAVAPDDAVARAGLDRLARIVDGKRVRGRRSAVDRLNDPPMDEPPAASLVERVSDAIERELRKIERIVGNPVRLRPSARIETESRARVLASLTRTMKEVMRLREQERDAAGDATKAADDDPIPRDLDEFRRELSRRLEGLVAGAAPLPAGEHEPG